MQVPLFRTHIPPRVEVLIGETLRSGYIAQGTKVAEFETRLGAFLGAPQICSASESSAAITLALYAAGVRPGDEVIVSPMSCLATTMPIANLFARPVWCDIDPATGMLDPARAAAFVTERTRALLAYHWSGNVADLKALREFTRAHGIKLIADASEAFGAEHAGRRLGAPEADYTIYSFAAVRHITSGEGAAIVVADAEDFERTKRLRRYGIDPASFRLANGDLNPASDIAVAGFNYAMNNIDATLAIAQLEHAEPIIDRYRNNGRYYGAELAGVPGLSLLRETAQTTSAYWTYSLRVERRADLMRKLHEQGIGCQRLHLRNDRYTCFAASRRAEPLPGVDAFDLDNLSIPCGWWVTDEQRAGIVECIRSGW